MGEQIGDGRQSPALGRYFEMEALFFWIFAIGMLLSGASVVLNRNPVASALSLVVSMCFLSALFALLNAYLLAAIQILVYAGAVMVLFLFIIMLLDLKAEEQSRRRWLSLLLGLAVAAFFSYELAAVLLQGIPMGNVPQSQLPAAPASDVVIIGRLLFTKYLLPFELVGVLLLVATVGVVLLSKRDTKPEGK